MTTQRWQPKPAHVVADMPYAERLEYEADRRNAMAEQGITDRALKMSRTAFHRDMMKRIAK